MPLSAPIPPEVIRIILGNLKGNKADLKNTALVSSIFLEPSQAHLFALVPLTVHYTPVIKKQPVECLLSAFDSNPNLALHIREIELKLYDGREDEVEFPHKKYISDSVVAPVLRMIKRLKSLTLFVDWGPQTVTFKSAILDMCRAESLSHINLFYCPGFPISYLSCLHQLHHLTISEKKLTDFTNGEIENLRNEVGASHSSLEILELGDFRNNSTTPQYLYKTLIHPHSLLNVSKLRVLKINSTKQTSTEVAWKIMRLAASTLECLHWNFFSGFGEYFSHTPVDFALLPGLRILSLSFDINGAAEHESNATWIVESLQRMAGRNILEGLALVSLCFFTTPEVKPIVETFLQQLDVLLTGGDFPHLTQLKIFPNKFADAIKQLEVFLRSLPRSKAAGILSVDFDYPQNQDRRRHVDFLSGVWKCNYGGG